MAKKLYCIEIQRECEELMVEHHTWDNEPTRHQVLKYVQSLDINYNDDYGKIHWYPVESYKEEVDWKKKYEDLNNAIEEVRAKLINKGMDDAYMILVNELSEMKTK